MAFRRTVVVLVITIYLATSGEAQSSKGCKPLPYPFRFPNGIELNCSNDGNIKIGEFQVRNITKTSIFVDLPAKCNRSIESIRPLFGKNYGLTWRNSLFLQDCNASFNSCVIPFGFVEKQLSLKDCNPNKTGPLSCLPPDSDNHEIMNFKSVNRSSCKNLFASIAVDSGNSLEFQSLELGWWLNGSCNCHPKANCTKVARPARNALGFRCQCRDGYAGDGFNSTDASGCKKVSECRKYLSGRCGGLNKVAVLVGGIIAGAILMGILIFLCKFFRRISACVKNRTSAKRFLSQAAGNSSVAVYHYKEIEKATNGFSEDLRLGTGAFGMVYAGKIYNDELVAIKKIKYRDNNSIDQVMNEIKLLSSVSHPNLVRLLGCCIEEGEQILIYEFMPNGTLSEHLQRERGKGLPWTIRLTVASETANAIAYLHSAMNPPIYHRDIKSSNILLDFSFKSKVADFGLSRLGLTDTSHISTAPQGTPGYVDPQYHQNFHLSDKSDVYSFGVVLVEIITALKAVDFNRPQSEVNLAALAIDKIGKGCVDDIIDPFLDLHRDAWTLYSVHKVAELAFRCLAFHSDMRPSMMEVAEELDQIRQSGWATMDENICFGSSAISSCSSMGNGSEKSFDGQETKKGEIVSQRLIVSRRTDERLASMEEDKDSSPVSVQDPWLSEQSSPSTNSLLGNVVR